MEQTKIRPADIAAISFSAIMNTCLPVDNRGTPLRNAIIWADRRGTSQLQKLYKAADEDTFYRITGHRINGTYCIAKMLWLKEHEPQLFNSAHTFLQAKDYIIYKMTGNFITDYSDASHLGFLDQHKKTYWSRLLAELGIPEDKMPELKKSTDIAGCLTAKAAEECGLISGIPVIVGGGDGCCATAGAGVYEPGSAYNVLGTSSWNGTLGKTPLNGSEKICFSLLHLDGIHYIHLGTMQSAGHSLEWLMNNLFSDFTANKAACYAEIDKEINASPASGRQSNLLYLPYLMGERSPWWNPDVRGAFIGLHPAIGRTQMIRACMEGVAFNLKIILNSLERDAGALSMLLIGGGAQNKTWTKIIASVWEKEIIIPKYLLQATSLGAVLCAGVGAGIFDDFSAIRRINPRETSVVPDETSYEHYRKQYELFTQAYTALVPLFKKMNT